ncbi:MAG: peptidoglycan recognition protein family protein [Chloroflexi bacterium]|nr:peptidoglycan recognition protein family protein [Chloroflexota bacterium]
MSSSWFRRPAWLASAVLAAVVALAAILSPHGQHHALLRRIRLPTPVPHEEYWIEPEGIVLHNSDTPSRMADGPVNAHLLERMHRHDHPSWATEFEGKTYYIGYHYVILPDGRVQKGRPDHCLGCHARKHNHWLGICVVGAFESIRHHWWPSRPTEPQIRSLVQLCEQLMDEYDIPLDRVKRHEDVQPGTLCPGVRFPYAAIMAQLRSYEMARQERSLANGVQFSPAPALGVRGDRPALGDRVPGESRLLRTVLPRRSLVLRG